MSTQTVSFEVESMPVTMVDGSDAALDSTSITIEAAPVQVETVSSETSTKRVTRLKDLGQARDAIWLDPRIILIDDHFNPRDYNLPENHAHLDALKRSIKENGTLVPLLVRYDAERKAAVLVDGECRLRANLELINEGVDIAKVPTTQVQGNNEVNRLITAISANTGKPLSKWELGGAFQRLYNKGLSHEEISTKTGYLVAFIVQCIELADAPDEVKQLLSSQAVSPALALAELRANGAAAVQTLQTIATEHKATGKKGPAKRAKAPVKAAPAKSQAASKPSPAPAPAGLPANVKAAILGMLVDVPTEDLNDKDGVVVVRVSKLLKVVSFAVDDKDLASIGITA